MKSRAHRAQDLNLLFVLVTACRDKPRCRADDEPRRAIIPSNHEVRKMLENEAVLDGSRLALVGVADDELLGMAGGTSGRRFPFDIGERESPRRPCRGDRRL